jgi:hypothetical protein
MTGYQVHRHQGYLDHAAADHDHWAGGTHAEGTALEVSTPENDPFYPDPVWVAVWDHRHGSEAFVSRTEAGLLRQVVYTCIENYLDEVDDEEVRAELERNIRGGELRSALTVWGAWHSGHFGDERVELFQAEMGP